MRTVQRIAKNTGVFFTAQVISAVLSFFFFTHASRSLGVENFGILSFALAITGIIGVLNDLGLGPVIIREVSKDKSLADKYSGNVITLKIILSVITFILIVLFANLFDYPDKTIKVIYLLGLAVICKAFGGIFESIAQAYEKMEYNAISLILNGGIMFSGALLAVNQKFDIIGFALIYLFAAVISTVYNFAVCTRRFAKPKIGVDLDFLKDVLKEALPFALITVFTMILHWIDTVMLSFIKGDAVAGWYNTAYRLFFVLLMIPSALNVAIFPVMSRLHVSSKDALKFAYEKSFKYLTIIAIPIGVGGTLLAEKIILLIFGNQYQPAVIIFQILILSAVFVFMGTPASSLLNSTNRQVELAKIVGVSVVLNIFLNFLLIPKYSYIGAGIATTISTLLILFLVIIRAAKIGYSIPVYKIAELTLKAIISGLIMGVFVICFKSINLFLLILLSAIIYFTILYLLKGFDKKDIDLFVKFKGI